MRIWAVRLIFVAAALLLSGCGATRQEVAAKLGDQFVGQSVDVMVAQFGPPANSFKMTNGGSSYVWQLAATTDVAIDRGYGSVNTRTCKVNVLTDPRGIVTQLNTEDSNASTGVYGAIGIGGTICSQRLGIRHQS
jgi:hypothetical protein